MDIEIVWSGEQRLLTVEDGTHGVGRAGDNTVQIPYARVSKKHATIRVEGGKLWVSDLGSSNGTEVNGQPVLKGVEVEVPEGSIISFAGALLRRAGATGSLQGQTMMGQRNVSTRLRYNIKEGYSESARDRIVGYSSELFELLASGDKPEEIERAACGFVARCVTADRVMLVENVSDASEVQVRAYWTKTGDKNAPLNLSLSIARSVMAERDSILVANALEDPRFGGQKSVMALNLRSAMAAPLFDNQRVLGILYVDTANPTVEYGRDDLEVLTAAANAVAVKLRNLSFEKEMKTAAKIQHAMLPAELRVPSGYQLDAHQVMCHAVGGDLYHCVPRPDGTVLLVLGDVSGKGMPAALAMAAAMCLVSLLAEIGGDLLDLAGHLHRQLYQSLALEQFITMFMAELNGEKGTMKFVNAGHDPPMLWRSDGTMETLDPTGLPMAMVEDIMLDSGEVEIRPGDLLVVFSDGIPEATVSGDGFLGLDPVKRIIEANRSNELGEIRQKLVTAVDDYLAGSPPSDDVTLILLRREAQAA